MDVGTKIYLDFLPLCGKGVFISNSRYDNRRCVCRGKAVPLCVFLRKHNEQGLSIEA